MYVLCIEENSTCLKNHVKTGSESQVPFKTRFKQLYIGFFCCFFCFHLQSQNKVLVWRCAWSVQKQESVLKVGVEAREHREDEVPKRGVLRDEEAGGVDVGVLQGGLLLGGDVLLLRAVPRFLQAGPGGQRDVRSGAVHGLVLHQSPFLFVELGQNGYPGLVLNASAWRVGSHVVLTGLARDIKHLRSPLNTQLRMHYEVRLQFLLVVVHMNPVEGGKVEIKGSLYVLGMAYKVR